MQLNDLKKLLSLKFDLNIWNNLLNQLFPKVEFFTSPAKVTDSSVKTGGHIGNIRLDDGRSLAIFSFEVIDNILIARNRKGLREIAAKYIDQSLIHGALVFYYSANQDDYRLTFIAKQTFFNEKGELEKKETAPKRYTFLLGPNEPCTTAAKRLLELFDKKSKGSIYLVDVVETFSVERLNKEFFTGYKAQYTKFIKQLPESKRHRDYVKKLLGRLVFLQFLQKKGWMGVPASNTKWEGGDKEYLLHLIERHQGNDFLLSNVLEPLFFNTLNEPRTNDLANCILGENIKIPYLNGGLFEEDELDKMRIDFSYDFFKELIHFFSQYNFTIDENDPDDSEVGIDPEMLGHIFENLLEDNKDKGAFYTPKEIVQYMSRQSIIQYLKTYITEEKYASAIDTLVNTYQIEPILQNKEMASLLTTLLQNVKVCDPAIGSGAFPMGIMNVLFHTRHTLHAFADKHGSWNAAQVKREIIQNNIFGVDIEQGAVDIARLRFWLALVVDADTPQPLPNLDYKITCGNSLLSRYAIDAPIENVFVEYNKDKPEEDKMSFAKYKQLVNDFTNSSDHIAKEDFRETIEAIKKAFKVELSNQFKLKLAKLRGKISTLEAPMLFGERAKSELKELKKLKIQLDKLEQEQDDILTNQLYSNAFEWRFEFPQLLDENGKFTGFDIVIGNPPYGAKLSASEKALYKQLYSEVHMRTPETFCYFTALAFRLSSRGGNGVVSYIVPNNIFFQNENEKTRELLFLENMLLRAINLGDNTFENADVPTCIFVAKAKKSDDYSIEYSDYRKYNIKYIDWSNAIEKINIKKLQTVPSLVLGLSNKNIDILNEIRENGVTIDSIAEEMASGISTGDNNAFIISHSIQEDCKLESILLKKILIGSDIDRYSLRPTENRIIYTTRDLDIHKYPYTESYLKEYYGKLSTRSECKSGVLPWFALGRSRYEGLFIEPKIIMRQTSDNIRCVYDENGFYVLNSILVFKKNTNDYDYKYIASILNSKITNYLYRNLTQEEGRTFAEVKPANVRKLYIPRATHKEQELLSFLYDYMVYLRDDSSPSVDDTISNKFIGDYFERIIDGCAFELFFREHMKERGIDIMDDLYKIIRPIDNAKDIASTISSVFDAIYKTDNNIRTRLGLFVSRSPEYLKVIIQS